MSVIFKLTKDEQKMDEHEAKFIRTCINEYGIKRVLGVVIAEVHSIAEQAQDEGESYTVSVCKQIEDSLGNAIEARRLLDLPAKTDMKF